MNADLLNWNLRLVRVLSASCPRPSGRRYNASAISVQYTLLHPGTLL